MRPIFSMLLPLSALLSAGCVSNLYSDLQAQPEVELGSCDAPAAPMMQQLVGNWTLSITADEGWTGYGESSIVWDTSRTCGLSEISNAVFNQESETPMDNRSTTLLVFDTLSETMKLLTSDSRGYVHLGFGADPTGLSFEIARGDGSAPTRRIQYRDISADAFEWVWQGRAGSDEPWQDRLTINYDRR